MGKTKLGISIGFLGAALYFIGLFNFLALIALAGYILIFEKNEWLKRSAVKAIVIVIGFALVSVLINLSNDILGILSIPLSLFKTSFRFSWPLGIDSIALNALNIIEKLLLLVLGLKAFNQGSLTIDPIDKVVDKIFNN